MNVFKKKLIYKALAFFAGAFSMLQRYKK